MEKATASLKAAENLRRPVGVVEDEAPEHLVPPQLAQNAWRSTAMPRNGTTC